ncbi:uncharacterized protein LOC121732474 [Aricia agestis]|uniref:uncharacterized protein LOC121732474 n=1 Tax=Aricia agestis TaxID=91739 RepID=UPI001C208D16|nr:uncharacterized protein LOC121732474 [Aricia agestis]
MFSLILSFLISASVVVVFRYINTKYKPPVLGIYQQENKNFWPKFLFMYVVLKLKQLKTYVSRLASEYGTGGTIHVQEHDLELEQKFNLGSFPKSVDAVYFNGLSKEGDRVVCGVARRPNQACDAFLYLKVKDGELLLSPQLPDSYLSQTPEDGDDYKVQGISAQNFIPMRTWKVSYNGKMKSRDNPDKTVSVVSDLTWSAGWAPFEYDTQISARSTARDMAREPWSRDYFQLLQKLHQKHYEQMGFIAGTVTIDGKSHEIHIPCVRDRTCATIREWRNFHRYVLHFIFLENGDCMAVGSVSQPSILSHLTIGYVCRKDQTVCAVDSCDFQLYQHGEHQILPKDYGFTFEAGGESYVAQVQVFDEDYFYIGKERDTKIYERWSDVIINGVKGVSCVEWQYNNV